MRGFRVSDKVGRRTTEANTGFVLFSTLLANGGADVAGCKARAKRLMAEVGRRVYGNRPEDHLVTSEDLLLEMDAIARWHLERRGYRVEEAAGAAAAAGGAS